MSRELVNEAWENVKRSLKLAFSLPSGRENLIDALQNYINALAQAKMSTTHYIVILTKEGSISIRLCDLPKEIEEKTWLIPLLRRIWVGE